MRKNFINILILSSLFSLGSILTINYFNELNKSEQHNTFLSNAASFSDIHYTNSENFKDLLDFSDVSRESFEGKISDIRKNAQEAYKLIYADNSDYSSEEKQLLDIAAKSWLEGIELFEVSIITLIDDPIATNIEQSIAQSIVTLAIGDKAYSDFLFLTNQNAKSEGAFLPNFYQIEYIGLEDNSYKFADLLVDKAKSSTGGLFLQKNLAVIGTEFVPLPIAITDDDVSVLLNQPTSLQVVVSNEGNVELYEVVILILVTDEFGETIYESQNKISSIGPKESKIFITEAINIEKGIQHEWFIKIEEIEDEEKLTDNILSVYGFIPPES